MADEIRLKAVNPELFSLYCRVKTIYALAGGEVERKLDKKKMNEFDFKKSLVIAKISEMDELCTTRDTSGWAHDSRDYIRLKNTIFMKHRELTAEVDDLVKTNEFEVTKRGSKISPPEIAARKEVLDAVLADYRTLFKRIKGYSHAESDEMTQAAAGMPLMTKDMVMKGTFAGAGVKVGREELTGEHMQKMELIRTEVAAQDALLDEISRGLDDLTEAATKIGDELQLQDRMLRDLEEKTDKAQGKMDKTNERLKDAMAVVNAKSTNICLYGICVIILLAVGVIIYNMLMKK